MKLKPCPFCGDYANAYKGGEAAQEPWIIECESAHCAVLRDFETKEDAVAAWNRRANQLQVDDNTLPISVVLVEEKR